MGLHTLPFILTVDPAPRLWAVRIFEPPVRVSDRHTMELSADFPPPSGRILTAADGEFSGEAAGVFRRLIARPTKARAALWAEAGGALMALNEGRRPDRKRLTPRAHDTAADALSVFAPPLATPAPFRRERFTALCARSLWELEERGALPAWLSSCRGGRSGRGSGLSGGAEGRE